MSVQPTDIIPVNQPLIGVLRSLPYVCWTPAPAPAPSIANQGTAEEKVKLVVAVEEVLLRAVASTKKQEVPPNNGPVYGGPAEGRGAQAWWT